jgi:hypothetical protein
LFYLSVLVELLFFLIELSVVIGVRVFLELEVKEWEQGLKIDFISSLSVELLEKFGALVEWQGIEAASHGFSEDFLIEVLLVGSLDDLENFVCFLMKQILGENKASEKIISLLLDLLLLVLVSSNCVLAVSSSSISIEIVRIIFSVVDNNIVISGGVVLSILKGNCLVSSKGKGSASYG